MTDLEITRLCAEAMGYLEAKHPIAPITPPALFVSGDDGETAFFWHPLDDDAQAMRLLKKFHLRIGAPLVNPTGRFWHVSEYGEEGAVDENLNRAICECVAKMRSTKT